MRHPRPSHSSTMAVFPNTTAFAVSPDKSCCKIQPRMGRNQQMIRRLPPQEDYDYPGAAATVINQLEQPRSSTPTLSNSALSTSLDKDPPYSPTHPYANHTYGPAMPHYSPQGPEVVTIDSPPSKEVPPQPDFPDLPASASRSSVQAVPGAKSHGHQGHCQRGQGTLSPQWIFAGTTTIREVGPTSSTHTPARSWGRSSRRIKT
jgi:hypothetical protein